MASTAEPRAPARPRAATPAPSPAPARGEGGAAARALVLVGPLPPPFAGQSVSFEMLVDAVRRRGIAHRVVNLANGAATQAAVGRASVRRAGEYLPILGAFFRAAAGGRRKTVYLTIAQSRHGFVRDAVMIWFARLMGHRVVAHLKGGNYDGFYAAQGRLLRFCVRATLRRVHRLLVLGERLRAMYDFEPALSPRIRVVPNGLPEAGEPDTRAKTLPAAGEARLLFLSNLIESKGWLDVLEAVRLLRDRYGRTGVRCDFHGEFLTNPADDVRVESAEQARALFESFVAEHGLQAQAVWHGSVSGAAKRAALAGAHVFVLPTRYSNEGQPVSIIEAMAYGNVVVSTDYRAIPDLVDDGATGVLVPYGDPAALAAALDRLLGDPARYAEMSRAAVARFRARFTREAHLRAILAELLGPAAAGEG
jgi:glycosyltransferase involved in cell wall biosynthesis